MSDEAGWVKVYGGTEYSSSLNMFRNDGSRIHGHYFKDNTLRRLVRTFTPAGQKAYEQIRADIEAKLNEVKAPQKELASTPPDSNGWIRLASNKRTEDNFTLSVVCADQPTICQISKYPESAAGSFTVVQEPKVVAPERPTVATRDFVARLIRAGVPGRASEALNPFRSHTQYECLKMIVTPSRTKLSALQAAGWLTDPLHPSATPDYLLTYSGLVGLVKCNSTLYTDVAEQLFELLTGKVKSITVDGVVYTLAKSTTTLAKSTTNSRVKRDRYGRVIREVVGKPEKPFWS